MKTIGIRSTPKEVIFAIYDSTAESIVTCEKISVPRAMDVPSSLKYIRNNLLDILREYEVERAGIRVTEPSAKSTDTSRIARVQIEGVIQEAFASSNLKGYYIGHISNIASKINIPRADFKKYIDGTLEYELEGWGELSGNTREALLCAIGAAND